MSTKKKRGRILRWGAGLLVVLVILFLVASFAYYVLARSARSRWERLASELRAKGQPVTYADIDTMRPTISEGSNGEVAIRRAAEVLESVTLPDWHGVLLLDGECKGDFFKGIHRECLPRTRKYVEARRQALAELSELTRFADVRLKVPYDGTMSEITTKEVKLASQRRRLGKLANLDTLLEIVDGDVPAAVDGVVLQLRLSEPLHAEYDIIPQLVAIASDSLVVAAFEGLLQAHELAENDLDRLQLEWNRHMRHQTLRASLLGLRASIIRNTDKERLMAHYRAVLAARKDPPERRWRLPNPIDWIPFKDDWSLIENRVQGVAIVTRLLEASDDLSKLMAVARRERDSLPRSASEPPFIHIVLPSLTRSIELHVRTVARFRCVYVAIAAERFRLTRGCFPNAPEELVPHYIAELPRDPFDCEPIRLSKTDLGIVVYSVGENTMDDGGQVVPQEGERFGPDLGVRLVNPQDRGLRLVGDAGPEESKRPTKRGKTRRE